MTEAQITSVEQRMQQQWHDLVIAEKAGKPLEILEQMYDLYIRFVEEYNACLQTYQCHKQNQQSPRPARVLNRQARFRQDQPHDAKLAS